MEVLQVRRRDMKEYKMAGLHHAQFHRDTRVVEWGVYRWMMRRARGQEDRTRWSRRMRKMWNEWVALWGIQQRKPRCGRGEGSQHRESGAGQGGEGQGQTGHTVVCAAGTQRAGGEGTGCDRAVV